MPNNGGNISPSWEACKGSVGKLAGEITIIIRTSVACRIVASLYFPPIARKHAATRPFHQSMTISICQSYYVTYYVVRNGMSVLLYVLLIGYGSDCLNNFEMFIPEIISNVPTFAMHFKFNMKFSVHFTAILGKTFF